MAKHGRQWQSGNQGRAPEAPRSAAPVVTAETTEPVLPETPGSSSFTAQAPRELRRSENGMVLCRGVVSVLNRGTLEKAGAEFWMYPDEAQSATGRGDAEYVYADG